VVAQIQMARTPPNSEEDVRQHSGWLIPLVVFVVTAGLSALFLLFYLAPDPSAFIQQHTAPTTMTTPVALSVNGLKFKVPANYIMYREARSGGRRKDLALFTVLPDFRGYSHADAAAFTDHSADSPIIYILIRDEHLNLPESERFKRIYLAYAADPKGKPGPFGLTQYRFRNDSGYRDEDLFVGHDAGHLVVMRCWRFAADMPNPNCLRDRRLSQGVAMTYRFKRSHLGQWRVIAEGVSGLLSRFEAQAK
jgi:hypothetical protein